MKRFIVAAILAGALATPDAWAQRVKKRQKAQQERIDEGVKSGELTKKEALKLEKQEAKLHQEIKKDRADGGGLTRKERVKIEHKQDKMSEKIARDKHDNQTRK
ncbi:MAG: hypothetical protein ACRD96_04630 [Bryobacteraceae bacterium]